MTDNSRRGFVEEFAQRTEAAEKAQSGFDYNYFWLLQGDPWSSHH